jgi:OOP family OmpA-OmpF porin
MAKKQVLLFSLLAGLVAAAATGTASAGSTGSANDTQPLTETYVGANVGFGGKVYGGVLYENWGVEAVAFGTGKAEGTLKLAGKDAKGEVKMSGVGLVGVLPLRLGDFTLKGKLGAGYARANASYKSGATDKASGLAPMAGVGVGYAFNKNISLVADLDFVSGKYNKAGDKAGIGMFSIGASYKF